MSEEKKAPLNQAASPREVRTVSPGQPIRLKPSSTDYATFVRATINSMGLDPVKFSKKDKPDMRLLSLANWDS